MDKNMEISNYNSTANLTSNPNFQSSLSISSSDVKNEKTENPYKPYEHRQVPHPNSVLGSIVHMLKACIGTGILAMPSAFKNAGILTGSIGTVIAGLICTHTLSMLVKTSQDVCVDAKVPSMSFAETCGAAFTHGPKKLQSWGNFVKLLVDYSVALTYISVLCVYVVFIGSSFKEVLDVLLPEHQMCIQTYCVLTLIPLALLSQIRSLKYLVPSSALANILVTVVFAITMYYMFSDLPPLSERKMVADVAQFPLFLSTVIFSMEGIGVVMPIENEMARPQHFLKCPSVLKISMAVIIALFSIFGLFGYLQYGEDVKGSITLNLPQEDILAQAAKLLMAIVIYLSYPLQLYVTMEIITRMLSKRVSSKYEDVVQISIRTFLVIVSVGVAAAFPNLELVISFTGAIFFSTLGLFIPAGIDIVYRWNRDTGRFNYVIYKDLIIIIISLITLVSGSYVSVLGMIDEFVGTPLDSDNSTMT